MDERHMTESPLTTQHPFRTEDTRITRHSRRQVLALGAAAVAAMALAACGNSNDQSQNAADRARSAAASWPAGALNTVQAAPTSAAPTVSAAATTVSGAASGGDPASRNNKYKSPPPMTIDKAKKYTATIVTNKGTMKAD